MNICVNCEYFDLIANVCLLYNCKGYENKKCLHINCPKFKPGTWTTNEDIHIEVSNNETFL